MKKQIFYSILLLLFAGAVTAQTTPVVSSNMAGPLNHNSTTSALTAVSGLLYEQFDSQSNAIAFQNFEAGFDVYDCEAADDFVVPNGSIWYVDEVVISFSYSSLPTSNTNITVRFHEDNAGMPGTIIEEFVGFDINTNDFINYGVVPLPSPVVLKAGIKWVSVQVNLDFSSYGQIYWTADGVLHNNDAQWINPHDGFGHGTTWIPASSITGYPDLCFGIYGVDLAAVPFPIIGSILAFLSIGIASFFGIRRKRKKLL